MMPWLMLGARTSRPHCAERANLMQSDKLIRSRCAITADGTVRAPSNVALRALPARWSLLFSTATLPRILTGSIFGMAALGFSDSSRLVT